MFYPNCIKKLHDEAMQHGVALRGMIFIPELIPYGNKAVLAFLNDPYVKNECGDDVRLYYYIMMTLAMDAGMAFASKWHSDFSGLLMYVNECIAEGPETYADQLLAQYFPEIIPSDKGGHFFEDVYSVWEELHEPYWKLNDPRDYTFSALLAAYQLGISMMLAKLGY